MADALTLTAKLGGEWRGQYGSAPCPVCQPEGRREQRALSVRNVDGQLLAYCHKSGCRFFEIARAIGLPRGAVQPDPRAQLEAEAKRRAEIEKRAAQAHRVWQEAKPIVGTVAESYLRARGITCTLPPTLRFHPDCWHGPTARRHPAMVAQVDGSGSPAVHRTYLSADGASKALIRPSKTMLGNTRGGAVRLSDGPGPLVIAEGIETALSLASGLLRGSVTVWAALSAPGMQALRLPDQPGELTIASDGDEAGRKAAHALAERASALRWRVFKRPAPEGCDWNDILLAKGSAT